ncbi:MAG: hypothetical protein Q3Y08_11445, partial [Butyricicoccus sp.]|nr:hypothetical protein [Butyricicoccus sp.]
KGQRQNEGRNQYFQQYLHHQNFLYSFYLYFIMLVVSTGPLLYLIPKGGLSKDFISPHNQWFFALKLCKKNPLILSNQRV